MAWQFDFYTADLVWRVGNINLSQTELALTDFNDGDLIIDAGERDNDLSILDEGQRVY